MIVQAPLLHKAYNIEQRQLVLERPLGIYPTRNPLIFTVYGQVSSYIISCRHCGNIKDISRPWQKNCCQRGDDKDVRIHTVFTHMPPIGTLNLERGIFYRKKLPLHKYATKRNNKHGLVEFFPLVDESGRVVILPNLRAISQENILPLYPYIDKGPALAGRNPQRNLARRIHENLSSQTVPFKVMPNTTAIGFPMGGGKFLTLFYVSNGILVFPKEVDPLLQFLLPFTRLKYK